MYAVSQFQTKYQLYTTCEHVLQYVYKKSTYVTALHRELTQSDVKPRPAVSFFPPLLSTSFISSVHCMGKQKSSFFSFSILNDRMTLYFFSFPVWTHYKLKSALLGMDLGHSCRLNTCTAGSVATPEVIVTFLIIGTAVHHSQIKSKWNAQTFLHQANFWRAE